MIDLIGQKFGRLTVIRRMDNDKWRQSRWLCQCDCGNKKIIRGYNLKNGNIKSCGCLNKEIITKHGRNKKGKITGIYQSWQSMKERCYNPNNINYKNYGGRGIRVCKRWLNSFKNFLEDIGECPPGLTLDRKNNNKNYCKSNCRWATRKEQQRNRRDNLYVPYNGKKQLLIEWCEEHNMPYNVVYSRIYKYGWSIKRALTEPITKRKNQYN